MVAAWPPFLKWMKNSQKCSWFLNFSGIPGHNRKLTTEQNRWWLAHIMSIWFEEISYFKQDKRCNNKCNSENVTWISKTTSDASDTCRREHGDNRANQSRRIERWRDNLSCNFTLLPQYSNILSYQALTRAQSIWIHSKWSLVPSPWLIVGPYKARLDTVSPDCSHNDAWQ